jgi:hypothetical protein
LITLDEPAEPLSLPGKDGLDDGLFVGHSQSGLAVSGVASNSLYKRNGRRFPGNRSFLNSARVAHSEQSDGRGDSPVQSSRRGGLLPRASHRTGLVDHTSGSSS